MDDTVFLGELAWPEAAKRIASGAPIFLPVGATEQHGHHMALNVDAVISTAIAERAARRVKGLVAPTIPYGNRSQPRSGGGRQFPGTLNLRAGTLSLVIRDVLVELFRQKAKKIVVLNGHYENIWPIIEGIEMALDAIDRDYTDGLNIVRIDHWELLSPETLARVFPNGYPGIELEHASVIETSMMLALRPELVDLASINSCLAAGASISAARLAVLEADKLKGFDNQTPSQMNISSTVSSSDPLAEAACEELPDM